MLSPNERASERPLVFLVDPSALEYSPALGPDIIIIIPLSLPPPRLLAAPSPGNCHSCARPRDCRLPLDYGHKRATIVCVQIRHTSRTCEGPARAIKKSPLLALSYFFLPCARPLVTRSPEAASKTTTASCSGSWRHNQKGRTRLWLFLSGRNNWAPTRSRRTLLPVLLVN